MFRNSRPRPSPQTIELVRQLAYITGGALCGVTALYLEECRRRIQIVQRVLDKRRAILQAAQSSRRYSKVAVAAKFEDDINMDDVQAIGPRLQSWDEASSESHMRAVVERDEPRSVRFRDDGATQRSAISATPLRTRKQKYDRPTTQSPRTSPWRPGESRLTPRGSTSNTYKPPMFRSDAWDGKNGQRNLLQPEATEYDAQSSRSKSSFADASGYAPFTFGEDTPANDHVQSTKKAYSDPDVDPAHMDVQSNSYPLFIPDTESAVEQIDGQSVAWQPQVSTSNSENDDDHRLPDAALIGRQRKRRRLFQNQNARRRAARGLDDGPLENYDEKPMNTIASDPGLESSNTLPQSSTYTSLVPDLAHPEGNSDRQSVAWRPQLSTSNLSEHVDREKPDASFDERPRIRRRLSRTRKTSKMPVSVSVSGKVVRDEPQPNQRLLRSRMRQLKATQRLSTRPRILRTRSMPRERVFHRAGAASWRRVIQEGAFKEVEGLLLRHQGIFTEAQLNDLIEASSRLKDTDDSQTVFDFYTALLNPKRGEDAKTENYFKQKMRFLSHAVTWNLSLTPRELGRRVLDVKVRQHVARGAIVEAFETECRQLLLTAGGVSPAANLWMVGFKYFGRGSGLRQDLLPISTEILNLATERKDLELCVRILRLNGEVQANEDLKEQFNTFVEACGRQKSWQLLTDLIENDQDPWPTQRLMELATNPNKAVIAVAFGSDPKLVRTFNEIYRQVPNELRSFVDEQRSVEALSSMWIATQNVELIEEEASRLMSWLKDQENNQGQSKVQEVLLKAYLDSHKYEKALDCLAQMHQKQQGDVQFVTLAALYFAKRWDWEGLTRILDASKKHGPFEFDETSTRSFNDTIYVYTMAHSSIKTWMFVTAAIDDLGFVPTFGTTRIMFGKMIRVKSVDLIPRWLRFMSAIEAGVDFTGSLAAGALIRLYYKWNRPSSSFLFQICDRLTLAVPSLNAENFKSTLKLAIGHDLRRAEGSSDWAIVKQEAIGGLEKLKPATDVASKVESFDEQDNGASASGTGDHLTDLPSRSSQQDREELLQQTTTLFNQDLASSYEPEEAVDISKDDKEPCTDHVYFDDVDNETHEDNETFSVIRRIDTSIQSEKASSDYVEGPIRRLPKISRGQKERMAEMRRVQAIAEEMTLGLALKEYQDVLDLYHGSLDAKGLPASARILRNAVHAGIRLHGHTTYAKQLIGEAKQVGMDVSRATGPLLMNRTANLQMQHVGEAKRVCDAIIEYCSENFKNGNQLDFALAHTVAHTLTIRGHATQALRLLSTIFQSEQVATNLPRIQTMSIWVKAYAQLLSVGGIKWAVQRILSENIRIDHTFMLDLEKVLEHPLGPKQLAVIRELVKICNARRREQDLESKIFGHQLVDCIIDYAHKYPTATKPRRKVAVRRPLQHHTVEHPDETPALFEPFQSENLD